MEKQTGQRYFVVSERRFRLDNLFSELKPLEIWNEKQCGVDLNIQASECSAVLDMSKSFDKVEICTEDKTSEDIKAAVTDSGIGVLHTTANAKNQFIKSTQEMIREKQMQEVKTISNMDTAFPYKRAKLLTDAELQLFNFMQNNLCQIDRITIFIKVRLADIAEVDNRVTLSKDYLWKITNKHVDFLICEKDTLDIICAVELDDYTHENQAARERDMFVMQVLDTVGVKTARVRTRIRAIEKSDLALVDEYINRKLAPKCPYCGKQMYPKISRVGHRFYACEDFINCRRTVDIDPRGERLP